MHSENRLLRSSYGFMAVYAWDAAEWVGTLDEYTQSRILQNSFSKNKDLNWEEGICFSSLPGEDGSPSLPLNGPVSWSHWHIDVCRCYRRPLSASMIEMTFVLSEEGELIVRAEVLLQISDWMRTTPVWFPGANLLPRNDIANLQMLASSVEEGTMPSSRCWHSSSVA